MREINKTFLQFDELDPHVVTYGLIALATSGILRILVTIMIAFGDKLNWKEKVISMVLCNMEESHNEISFLGVHCYRC